MTKVNESKELNLTSAELDLISSILNRTPNTLELELFSRLWSEHASYKNSMKWLQKMPISGDNVIVKAGEEKAGAIDIGNGYACVFKMESHNHPCAIQPRLGALTGMRVVTRDVFAMGAKPVALLDSLRFGESDRDTAHWLFNEVIGGIQTFEKTMNLPVIGSEVSFNKGFNSSPIVNNMAIGIAKKEDLVSGVAAGVGNVILIIGAQTGNEGIDNDTFSADFISDEENNSLSIEQMLDSTIENSLLKSIKELNGGKHVIGIQTIGAGGIVEAATEMASRGKMGIKIECAKIPARIDNMTSKELLLSETWGRVLLCVDEGNIDKVKDILAPKQLSFAVIGEVTDEERLICMNEGEVIAEIPTLYVGLGDKTPVYEREIKKPEYKDVKPLNIEDVTLPDDYNNVISVMLKSLNLASKERLMDTFDLAYNHLLSNSDCPSDAAFIDIKDINKTLLVSLNCNSNYVEADPFVGAQIAVAEAARNIICGGGVPLAVTDCLNFGNPYDPEVFWQFTQAVEGLSKTCQYFNTPIISGNVSFYNQKSEEGIVTPVIPSPIVGMVGVLEDEKYRTGLSFKHKGDVIFLIGQSKNDINASEYLSHYQKIKSNAAPCFNMQEEQKLQDVVKKMIRERLVCSVHNVSSGGLFFNMLESSVHMGLGFDITTDAEIRKDAFLFGESQGRVVVSVSAGLQEDFVDFMLETNMKFSVLGHVTKGEIRIDDESYGFLEDMRKEYITVFKDWMDRD